jgi:hypothetical protein
VPFISDRSVAGGIIIFTFIGLVADRLHHGAHDAESVAADRANQTVPRTLAASSMGLVVGAGEIVGGVLSPTISGWIADQTSLVAHMVVMMVCSLCGGVLSLFLRETAPTRARTALNAEPASET